MVFSSNLPTNTSYPHWYCNTYLTNTLNYGSTVSNAMSSNNYRTYWPHTLRNLFTTILYRALHNVIISVSSDHKTLHSICSDYSSLLLLIHPLYSLIVLLISIINNWSLNKILTNYVLNPHLLSHYVLVPPPSVSLVLPISHICNLHLWSL